MAAPGNSSPDQGQGSTPDSTGSAQAAGKVPQKPRLVPGKVCIPLGIGGRDPITDSREEDALILGPLAIHRRVMGVAGYDRGWTVTHIVSGGRATNARTKDRAIAAARDLLPLPWETVKTISDVKQWPKVYRDRARAIRDAQDADLLNKWGWS